MSGQGLEQLKRRILNKEGSKKDAGISNIYFLIKELHFSLDEIAEMPISAINVLVDQCNKERKEQDKKTNKHRGRR